MEDEKIVVKHQFLYRLVETNKTNKNNTSIKESNWCLTSHMTEEEMISLANGLVKMYRRLGRYVQYTRLTLNPKRFKTIKQHSINTEQKEELDKELNHE